MHQTINAPAPQPTLGALQSTLVTSSVPRAGTTGAAAAPSRLLGGATLVRQSSDASKHTAQHVPSADHAKQPQKPQLQPQKPQPPKPQAGTDGTLLACGLMTPASKAEMAKAFIAQAQVMSKIDKHKALQLYHNARALVPNNAHLNDVIVALERDIAGAAAAPTCKKLLFGAPLADVGNTTAAMPRKSPAKHKIDQSMDESDAESEVSVVRGPGKRARLDDSEYKVGDGLCCHVV